jgi:hypothetical protein
MEGEKQSLSDEERLGAKLFSDEGTILEEFNAKQPTKPISFNQTARSFKIPSFDVCKERVISLEETVCSYKKLIFSVVYTSFYRSFILNDLPKSNKREIHSYAPYVTDFLNQYEFESEKEIYFFKEFEENRINSDKVKPASTGLQQLLKWVRIASEFDYFTTDSAWQKDFIESVLEIRTLGKNHEIDQTTLTDWFSYSTWLRSDDFGVGHDLYSRLASPKALMKSFISTVTVQLNEIQSAKDTLIDLFKDNNVQPSDFPLISKKVDQTWTQFTKVNYRATNAALEKLRELYFRRMEVIGEEKEADARCLKLAIQFVIRECAIDRYFELFESKFFANKPLSIVKRINGTSIYWYQTSSQEALFSLRFLNQLAVYAQSDCGQNIDKPKTVGEQTIFSWIMAYQTVQPSDIQKLKLKDFRFVRRNNGKITHIDLEYFKGRADCIHHVRTLDTNTLLGAVVLSYIQDFAKALKGDNEKKLIYNTDNGLTAMTTIFESCGCEVRASINKNLKEEKISPVFIESMLKILKNGIRRASKKQSAIDYAVTCKQRVQRNCFSLTAIKNSAVHARSDTFTPTQLINYHSHTDETERKSYLSERNFEWQNRSGLVTRAVMNDMTVNLFRASDSERASFNSEFTRAVETINAKKNDMLARLKLITGKTEGEINDLGFVKKTPLAEEDAPDAIYLLDTPETVVKLLHYRVEAEKLHHILMASAPEFLLFTVLPTTEWIEELFDKKSFSKSSTDQGTVLYKRLKKHLSPLFQNHIQ